MKHNKKLKIIIIDDDPSINLLLKAALENQGHKVVTFSNPTECLAQKNAGAECQQSAPCADVIISDIVMPGMSGIELFYRQREKSCKISESSKALISATTNPEHFADVENFGCKFFRKPFKIADIISWLGECTEPQQGNQYLASSA